MALEELLDAHISATVNWKQEINWEENFEHSKRSALVWTLGFVVKLRIPYKKLQELDTHEDNSRSVALLIEAGVAALSKLLD